MQIRFDKFEKCYPTRLKKIFRSDLNYATYDQYIPQMKNALVGEGLPRELIKFFPDERRAILIKKFQSVLADLAKYLRPTFHRARMFRNLSVDYRNGRPTQDLIDFNNEITIVANNMLKRLNLDKKLVAELNFVDHGAYKSIYRLSLKDADGGKIMHDKAFGVYHNINEKFGNLVGQGNYAESNFWEFLRFSVGNDLGKTQFTKHYLSDLHNGYAMTEFADADIAKTIAPFDFENVLKVFFGDKMNNPKLFGKLYDVGRFLKLNDFTDDKMVRRYFKKLFYRNSRKDLEPVLKNLELEAQNPKNEHRKKIQLALELFKKTEKYKMLSEQH